MGYTTEFDGEFTLNKPLDVKMKEYLEKFSGTRRMKRDVSQLKALFGEGEYGIEGEYFVDGKGFAGQDRDNSIIDYNYPPSTQPGLWCQWVPNKEGTAIGWDGGEKFYDAEDWLRYIVENFLEPNGYILNGTVFAQGEDPDDQWYLVAENNLVRVYEKTEYEQISYLQRFESANKENADEILYQSLVELGYRDLAQAWQDAKLK